MFILTTYSQSPMGAVNELFLMGRRVGGPLAAHASRPTPCCAGPELQTVPWGDFMQEH